MESLPALPSPYAFQYAHEYASEDAEMGFTSMRGLSCNDKESVASDDCKSACVGSLEHDDALGDMELQTAGEGIRTLDVQLGKQSQIDSIACLDQ